MITAANVLLFHAKIERFDGARSNSSNINCSRNSNNIS